MRHDAGRKSRDMQRELVYVAECIFDNFDEEKTGYIGIASICCFLLDTLEKEM